MKRNIIYKSINSFGLTETSEATNPLTYCINNTIDTRFLHGGNSDIYGQHSRPCQAYLSDYCATQWDGFCEYASQNDSVTFPNNLNPIGSNAACQGLNAGEILIKNTAAKKYLRAMGNCVQKFEPFDPTVADSPMISYWIPGTCNTYSNTCIPVYAVDPKQIDSDVVMDKILSKPIIALDILINIFNTMTREGSIGQLKGTKLGNFYDQNPYFKNKGYLS
jgi:hypothetical protein